ncbi:hypothetical protein [Streptococcus merionis]|uniref:hypothetical protein n=1 Tax=Streptococcus merionis TaxID=400065 RepID=UPI003511084B
MNKRIKKKRSLENRVNQLETMLDYAIHEIIRQDKVIAELEKVSSRNTQATNSRFDQLEKKLAAKTSKKSWFGRK